MHVASNATGFPAMADDRGHRECKVACIALAISPSDGCVKQLKRLGVGLTSSQMQVLNNVAEDYNRRDIPRQEIANRYVRQPQFSK